MTIPGVWLNGVIDMQKACDFAACNHIGSVDSCGLNKLSIGCSGCVVSVGGDAEVRRRLLEMGFCNGASVQVIRRAPLGDPIEFRLRGYSLSLREEQARHVTVAPSAVG
jgi:ferrous iron transport protein A